MLRTTAFTFTRNNGPSFIIARIQPNIFARFKHGPEVKKRLNIDPQDPEVTTNLPKRMDEAVREMGQPKIYRLLPKPNVEEKENLNVLEPLIQQQQNMLQLQKVHQNAIRKLEEEIETRRLLRHSQSKQDQEDYEIIRFLCQNKARETVMSKNPPLPSLDPETLRKCKALANKAKARKEKLRKICRAQHMKEKCELLKLKKKCKELEEIGEMDDPCHKELEKKCKKMAKQEACKKMAEANKCKKRKQKEADKKEEAARFKRKCLQFALMQRCKAAKKKKEEEEAKRREAKCQQVDPCKSDPCESDPCKNAKKPDPNDPCKKEDPCVVKDPCAKDPCEERRKMRELCAKLAEIEACRKFAKMEKMKMMLKKCKKLALKEKCMKIKMMAKANKKSKKN